MWGYLKFLLYLLLLIHLAPKALPCLIEGAVQTEPAGCSVASAPVSCDFSEIRKAPKTHRHLSPGLRVRSREHAVMTTRCTQALYLCVHLSSWSGPVRRAVLRLPHEGTETQGHPAGRVAAHAFSFSSSSSVSSGASPPTPASVPYFCLSDAPGISVYTNA